MSRLFKSIILTVLLGSIPVSVPAFSLLGPFDTWQAANIGYQLPGDIGGPMNLAEEYRWDVPTIVYAFDTSFLNYFGQRGVDEVDKAFAILNNLPPVSKMSSNLTEYPLEARRINYLAQSLGIVDLKSTVLGLIVEQMGLAEPIRYTWCLRARGTYTVGGQTYTNYLVIKRNFDPVSWTNSSYVNGILYTYQIEEPLLPGNYADAVEQTVDPLLSVFRVPVSAGGVLVGEYLTSLTRDDIGGLRYIYRSDNYNIETLPPGITNTLYGGGGGYTFYFPTNYTQTNSLTNLVGNLTNAFLVTGLRPGLDKITFQKGNYDSVMGRLFLTNIFDYTDIVISNNYALQQQVRRVVTTPDIIFLAGDLGVIMGTMIAPVQLQRGSGFVSYAQTNAQMAAAGPGIIQGTINFAFTTLYPTYYNDTADYFLTEDAAYRSVVWGSFDGSTNTPVIYPDYISIRDIERQVLRR